jgi:hypothetical protein
LILRVAFSSSKGGVSSSNGEVSSSVDDVYSSDGDINSSEDEACSSGSELYRSKGYFPNKIKTETSGTQGMKLVAQ